MAVKLAMELVGEREETMVMFEADQLAVLQVDGMDGQWDNEMAAASVVPTAGMDGCSADKKDLHLIDGLEKNWGYSRVAKAGRVLVVAKGVNWDKKKVL